MKIIYILSGSTIDGGATKSFLAMMRAAVRAGHEVAVVCNDDLGVIGTLRREGITTFVTPYRYAALPRISNSAKDWARFIPRLIRDVMLNKRAEHKVLDFARTFQPDIIHENTSVTGIGHFVASRLGIPHIIHFREYGFKDFGIIPYNLKAELRYPNVFSIAITKDIARFRNLEGKNNARVIYNGIVDNNSISYTPSKSRYFLYAGRIEKGKGIEDLIDAYIRYADSIKRHCEPVPLKIAGAATDTPLLKRLKEKVDKATPDGSVEWLGSIKDIGSLYAKALATIIPSLNEGFGRVPPEAMANGSLCVMRDRAGLKEQLDNGCRLLGKEIALRFNSTSELASILTDISMKSLSGAFAEGGEYHSMIHDSQKVVMDLYSIQNYEKSILQIYKDLSR